MLRSPLSVVRFGHAAAREGNKTHFCKPHAPPSAFSPFSWHVLVGRNFGCFVTHEASKFIYFYIGQVGVCMYATA